MCQCPLLAWTSLFQALLLSLSPTVLFHLFQFPRAHNPPHTILIILCIWFLKYGCEILYDQHLLAVKSKGTSLYEGAESHLKDKVILSIYRYVFWIMEENLKRFPWRWKCLCVCVCQRMGGLSVGFEPNSGKNPVDSSSVVGIKTGNKEST